MSQAPRPNSASYLGETYQEMKPKSTSGHLNMQNKVKASKHAHTNRPVIYLNYLLNEVLNLIGNLIRV